MAENTAATYWARIYVAGPRRVAEQTCRRYCLDVGLCVTVEAVAFIYAGGEEAGVAVGLMNYPRFPKSPPEIFALAKGLAERLIEDMHQHSYSIMTPDDTFWFTRRDHAASGN